MGRQQSFDTLLRQVARAPGRPPFGGTERYEIVRTLGAGGFGTVYEAFDHQRGARIALKVLHRPEGEWLYRFKGELRVLANITHRNLLALYDLESKDGEWFLTMERIEGCKLRSYPIQSAETLRSVGAQLAEGIAALHAHGVLHGDVNPSNVMVEDGGRAVLLDFGLARPVHEGAIGAGTPGYVSPEQQRGQPATEASDWFALGVTLKERLTDDAPRDLRALCERLTCPDPSGRPDASELLATLGGRRPAASLSDEPFVGREKEMQRLRAAYDEHLDQRRPVVTVLRGPSGIGKTALAVRFLAEVRGDNPTPLIFEGRCYERETVPFKAFDQIVDSLPRHLDHRSDARTLLSPRDARALARLFPVLRRSRLTGGRDLAGRHDGELESLAQEGVLALRRLFARLASKDPVVLFVDDAQWSDRDSVRLLQTVLQPPAAPVFVLVTCRDAAEGVGPLVSALEEPSGSLSSMTRSVSLGPLNDVDCRAVSEGVLPGPVAPALVDDLTRVSGGNPFVLFELLRESQRVPGSRVPTTLEQALDARMAELPPGSRELLEAVSVAGRPIELDVAFAAADLPLDPRLVEALRRSRLLRTSGSPAGPRACPYHDALARAALEPLTAAARRGRHARLAEALSSLSSSATEQIAEHWLAAGEHDRARSHLLRAAGEAYRALAFERAARLYGTVLQLAPVADVERTELLAKQAEALAAANRGSEAGRLFLEAAGIASEPRRRHELRRRGADQLLRSGRIDEGVHNLRRVLRTEGLAFPKSRASALVRMLWHDGRLRVRGLHWTPRSEQALDDRRLSRLDTCWTVAQGLSTIEPTLGISFLPQHARMALDAGEPLRVARGLAGQAVLSARIRPGARITRRLVVEAKRAAASSGEPYALGVAHMAAGVAAAYAADFRLETRELDVAESHLRDAGRDVSFELFAVHVYGNAGRFWRGRLRELSERIPAQLEEAVQRKDRLTEVGIYAGVGCVPFLARDEPEEAERRLAAIVSRWSRSHPDSHNSMAMSSRMWIATYSGRPVDAIRTYDRFAPRMLRWLPILPKWYRLELAYYLACSLVSSALGTESRSARRAALRRASTLVRVLGRSRHKLGEALGPLVAGCIHAARGRSERSILALTRAEAWLRAQDMQMHLASARRFRGRQLGGRQGKALVQDADRVLGELGVSAPARMADLWAPGAGR